MRFSTLIPSVVLIAALAAVGGAVSVASEPLKPLTPQIESTAPSKSPIPAWISERMNLEKELGVDLERARLVVAGSQQVYALSAPERVCIMVVRMRTSTGGACTDSTTFRAEGVTIAEPPIRGDRFARIAGLTPPGVTAATLRTVGGTKMTRSVETGGYAFVTSEAIRSLRLRLADGSTRRVRVPLPPA